MSLIIKETGGREFAGYGRVLTQTDAGRILNIMRDKQIPGEVIYVPSDKELEQTPEAAVFRNSIFGGMPIQIGYCNGHNNRLNAVEYHRNSEVNIAVDDLILILGRQQDITEDCTYDTGKMEAFRIPAGTVLEIYATTLHYAPCGAGGSGFRCVVVLPEGTNTELSCPVGKTGEDALLYARNKWLIAHEESGLPEEGAYAGLIGANLSV